jgi:hypothetical protein
MKILFIRLLVQFCAINNIGPKWSIFEATGHPWFKMKSLKKTLQNSYFFNQFMLSKDSPLSRY